MIDDAIRQTVQELEGASELRGCAFEAFPFDALLPRIAAGEIVLPADEPGLRPYSAWVPADGIEVPVYADGLLVGRFVCFPLTDTCGTRLSGDLREHALELADFVGDVIAFEAATTRMARRAEGRSPGRP